MGGSNTTATPSNVTEISDITSSTVPFKEKRPITPKAKFGPNVITMATIETH